MDARNDLRKNPRYCRKCILDKITENDTEKALNRYILAIDEEIRTKADEYEKRLAICKACPMYQDGLCRVCGCFVKLRAAVRKNYCAAVEKKW